MIEKLLPSDDRNDTEFPLVDENGHSWRSKTEYLQLQILDFCGSGDPTSVMIYVRDFLIRITKKDFGEYEDLPYMFLCYWSDHKGFTEHGTTARCPWLTDLGEELLRDIEWCMGNEE